MTGQRCSHRDSPFVGRRRDGFGRGIIKDYAQAALVFACEFTDLKCAGLGGGLPIYKSHRVFRRMLANQVEFAAPSSHLGSELSRHHGQDIQKIVGFQQGRIDQQLTGELYLAALDEKRERKAGGQDEFILAVTAPAGELQLYLRFGGGTGWNVGEVHGPVKNLRWLSGWRFTPQRVIRQT